MTGQVCPVLAGSPGGLPAECDDYFGRNPRGDPPRLAGQFARYTTRITIGT